MTNPPFEYTLIDKRHKPFMEGQSRKLLRLHHWLLSPDFILALFFTAMGLILFLRPGIEGLVHDYSVRNDWLPAEATIVAITPQQSGDRFNWLYFYTFQTEDGRPGSGIIAEKDRNVFSQGQSVPILYLRTDPSENVYALDPLPKSILYWIFAGMGSLWVYIFTKAMVRQFTTVRRIQAMSGRGQVLPGEILTVRHPPWFKTDLGVDFEYIYTSPNGRRLREWDTISSLNLAGNPGPGTKVAVWWTADGTTILL